jgi:3-oxoacyl-[acyl-carrier-protein] synthase-3
MELDWRQRLLGINHISSWLPARVVDNRTVAAQHGFGEEFVLGKLGISQRHQIEEGTDLSDMATNAVKQLLKETGLMPEAIQILIVVTQTGDFTLPHTSAIVQGKTGISANAIVFDISLGCSGFVLGLDAIISVMERNNLTTGVLVTADAYSRIVDPMDRATAPLFGDAAVATLINHEPRYVPGPLDSGSQGSDYEKLILRGSGTSVHSEDKLFMDGRGILAFTRQVVPSSVRKVLERANLSLEEVDLVVFHQANAFVVKSLAEALEIPMSKVALAIEDVGNTTSSSIPLVLQRQVLQAGNSHANVLISGFGVGLSWATTLISSPSKIQSWKK